MTTPKELEVAQQRYEAERAKSMPYGDLGKLSNMKIEPILEEWNGVNINKMSTKQLIHALRLVDSDKAVLIMDLNAARIEIAKLKGPRRLRAVIRTVFGL